MNETKKLYRLDHGALAGVCGGVAEYFNVDANHGAPHLGGAVLRGHRRAVALCGGGPAAAQEEPGLPRLVRTTENTVRRPPLGRPPCFCYRYSEEALT